MTTRDLIRNTKHAFITLLLGIAIIFPSDAHPVLADDSFVHIVSDEETDSGFAPEFNSASSTVVSVYRSNENGFFVRHELGIVPSPGSTPLKPTADLRLAGVPLLRQKQTLTCEEAAAAMATRGRVSEAQLVRVMPRSANPFEGIRGRTNAPVWGTLVDYGTYAPALQRGLRRMGIGSSVLYGQTYPAFKASIVAALNAGRPVVWWTTFHEKRQIPVGVQLADGSYVKLVRYEHAGTIVGLTATGFIYFDPVDGSVRSVSFAAHQRASAYFDNMALVVD